MTVPEIILFPPLPRRFSVSPLAAALCAVLLAGCATFSQDGGIDAVSALADARTGQTVRRNQSGADGVAVKADLAQLLAKPLSADSAVQIALMNNKGLQASLAELGVAEADWVQAGRMRNPGFSFSRLRGGSDAEIDRGMMFDLAGLLTMPARRDIEGRRFEQAKLQAASAAVRLAADTRRAYFNAIAAQQTAQYLEQVRTAAEAGAELAQRMAKAGNFSQLDAAREQVYYADVIAQQARARQNAVAARERLTRLLGLWGNDIVFRLPERLPELPKTAPAMRDIEAQALRQRLDVQMARRDVDATASALGLTRATRFLNVLDAGYINKSQAGAPRADGYEVSLEIPLFDWGSAKSRKAESLYMASVNRLADDAVRVRSEVREAYAAYRTSYDLAHHYRDEVVPLRRKISDEMLLRYNGMLASVFELLADAREQAVSVNAAIEAQRDYWLAETALQAAINGGSGISSATDAGAGQ
jgi:outer membrane protein TolC